MSNPHNIPAYIKLGRIYVLLQRQDKQAIRVYNMQLRLNINTPEIEDINKLVAHLKEPSRITTEEIEILENELDVERKRQRR